MIEIPKKEPLNIVPFIDIMLVLLSLIHISEPTRPY